MVAKYGDKSVYFDLEDLGNTTGQWDLYGSDAPSPYNPLQVCDFCVLFHIQFANGFLHPVMPEILCLNFVDFLDIALNFENAHHVFTVWSSKIFCFHPFDVNMCKSRYIISTSVVKYTSNLSVVSTTLLML